MPQEGLWLDWCSYGAAKYAVEHWHYSGTMPVGKTVKIGVWEHGRFVGAIIFSRGATPHIGSPYGLPQTRVVELTRIAMREHETPVTRCVAIALRMLRERCPELRLVVSYADKDQGHHGGIYKGGNWIYEGLRGAGQRDGFIIDGEKVHQRTIGQLGGVQSLKWVRANLDPSATEHFSAGKHKYLMPLDDDMREQIAPLAKPYPKREED